MNLLTGNQDSDMQGGVWDVNPGLLFASSNCVLEGSLHNITWTGQMVLFKMNAWRTLRSG